MMEVSQNVELKELSTEGSLMRTISTELGNDVETLSTPAIDIKSRRSSGDEEDQVDLTNGVDGVDSVRDVDKSISDVENERNAGNDLDALLDKISSIVDCSSRNPDDLDIDQNEECIPSTEKEETADGTEDRQTEEKDDENGEEVKEEEEEAVEAVQADKNVEQVSDPEANDTVKEEEIKKLTSEEIIEKPNDLEAVEGVTDQKGKSDNTDEPHAEKNSGKPIASMDDVFMDALETISSSDDFETFGSQDSKNTNPSPKKKENESLEEICSEDDITPKKADKSAADIIDLDSSNECIEVKETEVAEKEATEIETTETETTETKVLEEVKDEIITEGDKEIIDDITSEEPVDAAEEAEPTENEEEEPKLVEEAQIKSAVAKEDQKDQEYQEEPMLIEDEEPSPADQPNKKEELELRTEAQELNDTSIDDLLLEENIQTAEKAKSTEKQPDPEVNPEKDEEPKVNGIFEKPSEVEGNGKEQEKMSMQMETSKETVKEPESDDEVIFFEPIDKTNKVDTSAESTNEEPKGAKEQEVKPTETEKDDEVVLVSEDEDDDANAKKPESEPSPNSEKEQAATVPFSDPPAESSADKDMLVDNSDNACDQFDKAKSNEKLKPPATAGDNSNSSSNLLRPAENDEVPAPKRIRLSTEEKTIEEVKTESAQESVIAKDAQLAVSKRSHDHGEIEKEKDAIPKKKIKTDDSDSNCSSDGTLQIDLDAQDEKDKFKPDESLKAVEEEKEEPIELKPKPEIQSEVKPLRMEFLKTFRKNFDHMTRNDLEELVLQKVVEGMLVKSDFAELRSQMDKCENILATYRRKIAEVSKQFLDLETVHKRVLKDLETKNSHFTAPVRITRAVGLQVGIPFKAMKPTVAAPDQTSTTASGSMLAPPSGTPPKASTSPMRSPLRARPPVPGCNSEPGPSSSLGPSRTASQQQQQRAKVSFGHSPAVAPPALPRRGCLQKITPQRPGPGNVLPKPQANNQLNMPHRLANSPPGGQRNSLHASKATSNSASIAAAAAAKAVAMRNRSSVSAFMAKSQHQQPQQQQSQHQHQYQTPRSGPVPTSGPVPAKLAPKCTTKVRAQPPPISGGTVSVPMASAGSSAGSAGFAQQQQPNLTPAKPKEKAVIDLTDEDDAAAAAAAAQHMANMEANARLRQASNMTVKRNSQAAAAASAVAGGSSGSRASVVRASPMQLARVNARQIVQNNGGGQRSSLGSNITMQIRSENTPPAASRLRYSHPAPLPSSPAQPFNPAWKMPPSRPVIRISLLDTGIVISWTLEDTSARFAECVTYQIYAYQETIHEPSTDSWRHVGDVKAMLLPMAVTLNQFQENQRYYFAVRGVDDHQRFGAFSVPKTWT
ncbi:hypothetical protein KR009_001523 [Drosophila setifemur]|nr:hypothetical protein KR009_001523 [Drosophila setifemur]